jgi:Phage terminase, small subunit
MAAHCAGAQTSGAGFHVGSRGPHRVLRSVVEAEGSRDEISKTGLVMRTPNGYEQKSAWAGIASENAKLVERFLAHFGMSPAARARVEAQPPEPDANQFARNGREARFFTPTTILHDLMQRARR